jgi:hypothetical protein
MKAQEKLEKEKIKLRFATALDKLLIQSGLGSYKKLAEAAGMEPAHIQLISVGQLDVTVTTCIAVANALGISYGELASTYDAISVKDVENYVLVLKERRRIRGRVKTPVGKVKKRPSKK